MNGRGWGRNAALVVAAAALLLAPTGLLPADPAEAQPGATRNPVDWPFPWDSIWNMPIGTGAVYVDAEIEPGGAFGVFADEDILILEPNAPLVNVLAHDADWDPNRERCSSILSPPQVHLAQVPVPSNFTTEIDNEGTPNAAAAILMPDGVTVRQTQPLHVCGPGGTVTSQYLFPDDNIRTGDGRAGAHGGASMSSIGGTIRVGELTPGSTITHALKVVIDSAQYTSYDSSDATPGYRWPAFSADFGAQFDYGGSVPALQMGALLALPPDFDIDSLDTEPARIIARAMQDYGGYLVDSSGWDTHYFATEFGPNGRVIDEFSQVWGWPFITPQTSTCGNAADPSCAWSMDIAAIFSNLAVVNNNGPNQIGGPGDRRTDCAPAFTDGTGGAPADCSPTPTTSFCDGEPSTIDMNVNGGNGIGTSSRDVIVGTAGDDYISGRGGNDLICGLNGDDVIIGGAGNDVVFAGGGDDYVSGSGGTDTLHGQGGRDALRGGPDADDLRGGGAVDDVRGASGDDTLHGNSSNDNLFGQAGNDTLYGGSGDDYLNGGAGDDTIRGQSGTDNCTGSSGFDSAQAATCEVTPNIEAFF